MITQLYDDEIERNILTILIVEPKRIEECFLEGKHFVNPVNRRCYEIFKAFYEENKTLEISLMSKSVNDFGQFADFCVQLMDSYFTSANLHFLITKQEEVYKTHLLTKIANDLIQDKISYSDFMQEISIINSEFIKTENAGLLPSNQIYDLITTDESKLKFRIFRSFQEKVGILEKTVNVIASRPAVGKTGFALNLMNDLSSTYKCIYFNMEMTEKEIYQRLTGINSSIPINRFTKLENNEVSKIHEALNNLRTKNMFIYNGSKSVKSIRAILSKQQREGHCIAFIDHIGYVTTGKKQTDTERIGEAVREIQCMTKDLNITVFLLAHINRAGSDAPTVNYLKDSGELEQSAHVVMLLHNPSADVSELSPTIDMIVDKNRSGQRGKIEFTYQKTMQIFKEKNYAIL